MRSDRSLRLAATVLAAAFALSACGETSRLTPSEHATPVAVASVPATVYPAPTKTATAAPSGSASASASPTGGGGGKGVEVKATATNVFDPKSVKIKKGETVTWVAEGFHTVTSGDAKGGKDAGGPMNSDIGFTEYSVTFDKAGTFKYFCQPHASLGMEGEVVVS